MVVVGGIGKGEEVRERLGHGKHLLGRQGLHLHHHRTGQHRENRTKPAEVADVMRDFLPVVLGRDEVGSVRLQQ